MILIERNGIKIWLPILNETRTAWKLGIVHLKEVVISLCRVPTYFLLVANNNEYEYPIFPAMKRSNSSQCSTSHPFTTPSVSHILTNIVLERCITYSYSLLLLPPPCLVACRIGDSLQPDIDFRLSGVRSALRGTKKVRKVRLSRTFVCLASGLLHRPSTATTTDDGDPTMTTMAMVSAADTTTTTIRNLPQ